jgi:hypothetical protein
MGLVLTGAGTLTGTVTDVNVNITYNVDSAGVDSLIETICDRKDDVSDCVVYGDGEASFDICSPGTPIAPYTEEILRIILEGFTDPCKAPTGSPCDFSIAGSFASSLSVGFGAILSTPCGVPIPYSSSLNGQNNVEICADAFIAFQVGVEVYSKNILGSVAEILRAVCDQRGSASLDPRGVIGSCILPEVYASFQGSVSALLGAALEAAADVLQNICSGSVSLSGGFSCVQAGAAGQALGQAAEDFGCFVVSEIAQAVTNGGSISICGRGCGWNACDMAKGLIDNCNLACYAFEKLIDKDCFKDYIEQYLEDNRCDILDTLLPDEASCADDHVIDWFAGALDRVDSQKKCNIFDKFIEEDGSAEDCITNNILAWIGKDENPCLIMEEFFGKIGVAEKAKSSGGDCVHEYIRDYVDAQAHDLLFHIFSNSRSPSKYNVPTSGTRGYRSNLRNGILNFVQDETCDLFAAITSGLQRRQIEWTEGAWIQGNWYAFNFGGQGATIDACTREFDDFIDAVFCRVSKKIKDYADGSSSSGVFGFAQDPNSQCLIEMLRSVFKVLMREMAIPGTFSSNGECREAKFFVDLKDSFVQDRSFVSGPPTQDDIKYIT